MNMMYNKNIKKAHAGHTRNRRECTMKSKKLAALGLTAVLSLGLLTACSGGSDDTNETPAGSTPPVTESGAPAADSPANWTSADALATA